MGSREKKTPAEEAGAVCPQGLRAMEGVSRWGAAVRAGELRAREVGSRAGRLALGWDRT